MVLLFSQTIIKSELTIDYKVYGVCSARLAEHVAIRIAKMLRKLLMVIYR